MREPVASPVALRARGPRGCVPPIPLRAITGLIALIALLALELHGPPAMAADSEATPQELPEATVIGSSPVAGTGVPINLYPGNAQTISVKSISPGATTATDLLNEAVGSVNLNDTEGNPYQMDLNFRGYTASPVLGTPQGLSVYVDGIRINEPFGDIVSWDLVPKIAISDITVVPGTNPVYGLNTLGGALAFDTKSGFAYPGASVSLAAGSFDRRTVDAEYGGSQGNTDFYAATSFHDDNGWAKYNPSLVRQFFSKVGFQDAKTELDFSITYVDDYLAGNQLVAKSMLEDAISGYSHPDSESTRSFVANLTARAELNGANSIEGNLYYRNIWHSLVDSNINDPVTGGEPDQIARCNALYGQACAGNVVSTYTQDIYGVNLQFSNHARVGSLQQYFSMGISGEHGTTHFSQAGQDAVIDVTFDTIGVDPFSPQSAIHSSNASLGAYATETLVIDPRASVTLSGRYDHSTVDLSGTSIDQNNDLVNVHGNHAYRRFDPSIGGTFVLLPRATLFANYGEGLRTPTAIELACADPVRPCAGVPSAFSSDPDLRAVVAKSLEVGARGNLGTAMNWRLAGFYSNLYNDIIFNQSTLTTGYFSNVGRTRRAGVEFALNGQLDALDFALATTWLDATYESRFVVANGANPGSACPGPACVPVEPGDKIPGLPALVAKVQLGYQVSQDLHLESQLLAQGSTFARGDENNLLNFGKIPGFYTIRLGFTQKVGSTFELSGGILNLCNRLYANFGTLSSNDLKGGVTENFWAVGQPRTLFLQMKAIF